MQMSDKLQGRIGLVVEPVNHRLRIHNLLY